MNLTVLVLGAQPVQRKERIRVDLLETGGDDFVVGFD